MAELTGTTVRVLALLRLLAESNGRLGVKDVSDTLHLPMSTSHRLLDMLVEAGFVDKDEMSRRYGIGMEYLRIANLVTRKTSAVVSVQPILDQLTGETGESSIFSMYLPAQNKVTYAAKCDSPDSLRYQIDLFEQLPLEWGATSLAILAYLPKSTQQDVFADIGPSPVSGKRLNRRTYDARIAKVRADGIAVTENEKLPDSVAIAVPLESAPGIVFGSLALTVPKFRFDRSNTQAYADLLRHAASQVFKNQRAAGDEINTR